MPRVMSLRRWCVVFSCLQFAALAQTPDTATIRGRVEDQSHASVTGVRITATNALNGFTRSTESDASGRYSLAGLPVAGRYQISAEKQGFATGTLKDVTLRAGATATVDLELRVASQVTEATVTGIVGEVRADEPQLGNWLGSTEVQSTPLLN